MHMKPLKTGCAVAVAALFVACMDGSVEDTRTGQESRAEHLRAPVQEAGPARVPTEDELRAFEEARASFVPREPLSREEMGALLERYEASTSPRERQALLVHYFSATFQMTPEELEEARQRVHEMQRRLAVAPAQ